MPELNNIGLQQIAEALVETPPITREPVARAGGVVARIYSGIAMATFATSVAIGFGGAVGIDELFGRRESSRTVKHGGKSQTVTGSVLSTEISRNISTRAQAARRYLQVLPKDDTPDPDWF